MIVSLEQRNELSRGHFYRKLREFLLERMRREDLQESLKDGSSTFRIWDAVYPEVELGAEYRAAVLLTYTLCRAAEGREPAEAFQELVARPEAEYDAKCYFEDAGVFRFSEFDL